MKFRPLVLAMAVSSCDEVIGLGELNDRVSDATDGSDGSTCGPIIAPETVTSGLPSWRMAELAAFAAPCGTKANFVGAMTVDTLFSPRHVYNSQLGFLVSAIAHDPPFDTEIATALSNGHETSTSCFVLSDVTTPNGIVIAMNLVPSNAASLGVSFEVPDGSAPVLAPSGFTITANLYLGSTLIDPLSEQLLKAAFVYSYPKDYLDGFGHVLLVWFIDQSLSTVPITNGIYDFNITLNDTLGNETFDSIRFTIQ